MTHLPSATTRVMAGNGEGLPTLTGSTGASGKGCAGFLLNGLPHWGAHPCVRHVLMCRLISLSRFTHFEAMMLSDSITS